MIHIILGKSDLDSDNKDLKEYKGTSLLNEIKIQDRCCGNI